MKSSNKRRSKMDPDRRPTAEKAPDRPAPRDPDVYDPVGMAGKEAGIVTDIRSRSEEQDPKDDRGLNTPIEITNDTGGHHSPHDADTYDPVGMAGKEAGIVDEVDRTVVNSDQQRTSDKNSESGSEVTE